MAKFADSVIFRCLDINRRLRGYQVRPVTTAEDWEEHFRLFKSTFLQVGYYSDHTTSPLEDIPGSINHAWLACYRGESIGTIRLVQHASRLPTERVVHVQLPETVDRKEVADIGHFVITKSHRRRRFLVTYCLLKSAYEHSVANGIQWWVGCAPAPLILSFLSHAQEIQLLEELPLEAEHIADRSGREYYFRPAQAIRPFLVDLRNISVVRTSSHILSRRIRQGTLLRARKEAV